MTQSNNQFDLSYCDLKQISPVYFTIYLSRTQHATFKITGYPTIARNYRGNTSVYNGLSKLSVIVLSCTFFDHQLLCYFRSNRAGDDDFFAEYIDCVDGKAFVFVSRQLLEECLQSKELFIDGTFRTVPKLFYQLVTIHMSAFSNVSRIHDIKEKFA